jgi:hypothetical protein
MDNSLLNYVNEMMQRLERNRQETSRTAMVAADRLMLRTELMINLLHEYNQDQDSGSLVEALSVAAEMESLQADVRHTLVALLEAHGRCESMPSIKTKLIQLQEEGDRDGQ